MPDDGQAQSQTPYSSIYTDDALRLNALQYAISLGRGTDATSILSDAEKFYKFMKGQKTDV